MTTQNMKSITILTTLLAVALTAASYSGAFVAGTYARETASLAAQGIGQDLVDLFLVVPLLLISLVFVRRQSRAAQLIFAGTLFYILYSFVIYSFGIHFNRMFLVYTITLGLSLYTFILVMSDLSKIGVENWFGEKTPTRSVGIFLIVVAAMFYLLWLKDVIPAVLKNTIPSSVSDINLQVNPVHVLDIGIALPGLVLTAVLLMRKRRLGYILAPTALVFIIILTIALAAMVLMTKARGINEDASIALIFVVLAVISSLFLFIFMKRLLSGAVEK